MGRSSNSPLIGTPEEDTLWDQSINHHLTKNHVRPHMCITGTPNWALTVKTAVPISCTPA